jgi:hypothetical protein
VKGERRRAVFLSCWACKPNSVCRSFSSLGAPYIRVVRMCGTPVTRTKSGTTVIPLGRALLSGSSDLPGSCDAPSRHVRPSSNSRRGGNQISRRSSPIWSCSVWGLPCHRHCWRRGALLPHLFTLTALLRARRYILCGTFRQRPFEGRRPDVIRHTALWSSDFPLQACATWPKPLSTSRQRPSGPAANTIIIDGGMGSGDAAGGEPRLGQQKAEPGAQDFRTYFRT